MRRSNRALTPAGRGRGACDRAPGSRRAQRRSWTTPPARGRGSSPRSRRRSPSTRPPPSPGS